MSRNLLLALAACLCLLSSAPAAAADVGVSVNVGQPGFYGRIDIGQVPPPRVIYAQPVLMAPAPVAVFQRPIYLHVPPGHARNWAKHCGRYNACSQPTYFVHEDWYHAVYAPAHGHRQVLHRHATRHDRGHRRGYEKGHGRKDGKSRH